LILLDTHVVVWLALAPERISKIARAAIDEARHNGGGLAICGITLLEIATANLNGRISLTMSLESFLKDIEKRFVVLPISARACARTLTFPADYPKDPADRVIGATALVEGMGLVTADREIRRAKVVRTIW
jgi:PIN domain nuclease of toxin-antitoxin system